MLESRYRSVRAHTEALAAPLSPEDQTVQSMPDVSPTKWHRAHTTWFFETFLLETYSEGYTPYDPAFSFLFNSYYEAMGARYPRPNRGLISRPGAAEVGAYRRAVDAAMLELLGRCTDPRALELVELGLHHEQQHQELLLMDIKHVLSVNPLQPAYGDAARPPRRVAPLEWTEFQCAEVEIGHRGEGFCFDNELPRHGVLLRPFAMANRLVSCGEWLAFIEAGGYRDPALWLSDGWRTVGEQGWEAPSYWSRGDDGWRVFTLGGSRALDPNEPVCHVSLYEADAYARWAGARLPLEAEWEVAAEGLGQVGERWEWTASPYSPYPGFAAAPGAVGEYNGKFMINQMVLRGGCCATPPDHCRPTYRNFYPPHSRWMFSGVRLARDLQER